MLDLGKKIVTIQGREESITSFQVWFQTPFGLFDDLDNAIRQVVENDLEPALTIRPVSVAVTASTYEVCGS